MPKNFALQPEICARITMSKDEQIDSSIKKTLTDFLHDLEGVNHAVQIAVPLIVEAAKISRNEFNEYSEPFKQQPENGEEPAFYHLPFGSANEFRKLRRIANKSVSASFQTPRALLVAMVSTYDAFIGRLLRSMYLLKPEQLNASERTISFSELVEFGSMEAAREHIISAEIESVLRRSHTQHLEYLESRLSMQLRKGLDSWPKFVELTQRRNLFVHADGIVSRQYLKVCSECGLAVDEDLLGKRIHVGPNYMEMAFNCLYEIGVKLAHTIWRKLAPDEIQDADDALNYTCYQLLETERYDLAYELLKFGTVGQPRHSEALRRRMMVVNQAIAVKFGSIQDVPWPLDNEDWSDCGDPFALAVSVLNDDFESATELMKKIGPNHDLVTQASYGGWPLFREFRESEQFRKTYKEIFGDEFTVTEKQLDESDAETAPEGETICDDVAIKSETPKDAEGNNQVDEETK